MSDKAERRPDLEIIQCSFPDYVTPRVLPFFPVNQSAGRIYYQDYSADITAQYNRSTSTLGSITTNAMAPADKVFGTKEVLARVALSYDAVKAFGNLDNAEISMAKTAKRSFYNKLEALTAASLLNDTSATDGHSDPVAAIDAAVASIRDKGLGKVAVVMSWHNFNALKGNSTVKDRMKMIGATALGTTRFIPAEAMAEIFGADEVILGADAIWYANSLTGKDCVAVVALPDDTYAPAEQVQLGRTINFSFDGEDDRLCIERYYDNATKAEVTDAFGLIDQQILNAELKQTISLVEIVLESSSSSSN